MSSIISSPVRPPAVGGQSPWGAIDGVERISDDIVIVFTASHGGAWLSPTAHARMPASIQPMHGRSWWEEDCEILAVLIAFGIHDRLDRNTAIGALARWHPDWLDALAPAHELPTAAQVARIRKLWADFAVEGAPDFTAFPREAGTGMVHGWIGTKIFVGVEPDGRAHS
jgi:hypothetical protein